VGENAIMWKQKLSCESKCYHVGRNDIIWEEMISCGTNVIMVHRYHVGPSDISGNICYHVGANFIM